MTELRKCRHGGTWEPYGDHAFRCSKCGDVDFGVDPDDYPTNDDPITPRTDPATPEEMTTMPERTAREEIARVIGMMSVSGRFDDMSVSDMRAVSNIFADGILAALAKAGYVMVDWSTLNALYDELLRRDEAERDGEWYDTESRTRDAISALTPEGARDAE